MGSRMHVAGEHDTGKNTPPRAPQFSLPSWPSEATSKIISGRRSVLAAMSK